MERSGWRSARGCWSARSAWSSASGWLGSACSRPMRRPARPSASASHPASWCLPPGGPRSGPAGGARSPRWRSASRSRSPSPWSRRAPTCRRGSPSHAGWPTADDRRSAPRVVASAAGPRVPSAGASSSSRSPFCTGRRWRRARAMASSLSRSATRPSTPSSAATSPRRAPRRTTRRQDSPSSQVSRPDLVPLGRAVARVGRHHDLRGATARCSLLHRPADRAARGGGPDRHRRAPADRDSSRAAYLFGFLACLFLAPVPLIPGPFFSSWAVGMIFGITLYGLGAVAGLLAMYSVARARRSDGDVGARHLRRQRRRFHPARPTSRSRCSLLSA